MAEGTSDSVIADSSSDEQSEIVEVTTTSESNSLLVTWQVWQPIPLALLAALLAKLFWVDSVAPFVGLTSQWWLDNGVLLFSGDIFTTFLALGSFYWYDDWSSRFELIIAGGLTTTIALVLVIGGKILCWPFLIATWVLITVVWGRYNLSARRTGVWLAVGGSVVLVLGGIMAHVLL